MPANLAQRVESAIREHEMLRDGETAILAVSGGPDSLALLHLVKEARDRSYPRARLHVGHLNHGIRGPAADADADFVCREARRLRLPCAVGRVDVPALARERGIGIEQAGREARYAFLVELARAHGATAIFVGHHADDQAETVLMRVRRGAGPRGLAGMAYVAPPPAAPAPGEPPPSGGAPHGPLVVRPLLDCRRSEIQAFLRARGLQARLDRTNLEMDHLRNRVRHVILPRLGRMWDGNLPGDLCRLARAAQRLRPQAERLCHALLRLHAVDVRAGLVETNVDWIRSLPSEIIPELLQRWLPAAGLLTRALSARDYERVRALLTRPRGRTALSGRLLACHDGRRFALLADRRPGPAAPIGLEVPGVARLDPPGLRIEAEALEGGLRRWHVRRAAGAAVEEYLDLDRLHGPIEARPVRAGDRMRPLGAPGRRKVFDILTDLHVPRWRRAQSWVLTAGGEPVWLVGCRIAEEVKVTRKTRRLLRLRISAAPGAPQKSE